MARGKGEGSVYKTSRGLWTASVELPPGLDGKRRRKVVSSKTKAGAVQKLREVQKDKATHGDIATRSITLNEWVEHWLTDVAPKELRPRTIASHRSTMKTQVLPLLGSKRIDQISPPVLRQAFAAMAENGAADSYLRQTYATLKACFRDAVHEGVITASPTDRMKPPRTAPKDAEGFTLEEAVKVLKHAVQDEELGALWCTILLTGVRRGEALGLEVERVGSEAIDLSWQLQHIAKKDIGNIPADYETEHLWGSWYLVRPKSRSGERLIPRIEPLASVLDRHIERNKPTRFLFTRDGERTLAPDQAGKAWNDMVKAAGVERRVTPHGARHTVVDLLYLAGVPEVVIMEIMGHSNISQTRAYRTRRKELSPQIQDAMRQMGDLLDLGEQPKPGELES